MDAVATPTLILRDDAIASDLVFSHSPDYLSNEQTWPLEEELENADKERKMRKIKGMSDYQAAWVPLKQEKPSKPHKNNEDNGQDIDEESYGSDESMTDASSYSEDEDSWESVHGNDDIDEDDGMDMEQVEKVRKLEMVKRERGDMEFPDEVDVPVDCIARKRFIK